MGSAVFNASVVVYDPYTAKTVDILTFEGITHNPKLHIGGVAADPFSNLVTIVVDAYAAFATRGKDPSGDNFIIKYDPDKKAVLWKFNITAVTGGRYSGFQDIETDAAGNTYIVGSFPGTILRVDKGRHGRGAMVPACHHRQHQGWLQRARRHGQRAAG